MSKNSILFFYSCSRIKDTVCIIEKSMGCLCALMLKVIQAKEHKQIHISHGCSLHT